MAIDVSAARTQSARIKAQLEELNAAISKLNAYRSELSASWQADEVAYYTKAIDQTIEQLKGIKNQLDTLSSSVVNTANAIAKEEQAAREKAEREAREKAKKEAEAKAKREREAAEKNKRIAEAQRVYDEILKERDAKAAELAALEKKIKKASVFAKPGLILQKTALELELEELNMKLSDA